MPFYIVIIIISFFSSLLGMTVRDNRRPPLFFFPFFLLLTSVVEFYGSSLSSQNRNNTPLYNFFGIFEIFFYLLFFMYLFHQPLMKKIILAALVFFLVFAFCNIFFIQGRNYFNTYTYVIGCMLMVTLSITYFYLLFRHPDMGSLTKNPFFWLVTALMFYYTCSFSLYGLENFIISTIKRYTKLLFIVGDVLNVLLYTSFSIGFLCKINFRKLLGLS